MFSPDSSTSVDWLITQGVTSTSIVYVLEFLKKSPWFPKMREDTSELNRIISMLCSGAGALGIHAAFNHAEGTLMITGLSLATIPHIFWDWLRSGVFTQAAYDGLIARNQTCVGGCAHAHKKVTHKKKVHNP